MGRGGGKHDHSRPKVKEKERIRVHYNVSNMIAYHGSPKKVKLMEPDFCQRLLT